MFRKLIFTLLLCIPAIAGVAQPAVSASGGFKVELVPNLTSRDNEVRAGLLYDTERKVIVWEKDMHYAYPIASLTKMMVALLATEDIRAGKADWSDNVSVERLYRKSPRSRKVIRSVQSYTLESLVQLAMIPSNNEACADIAKHLSGNMNDFVLRMNMKAQELGMNSTFYSNPSGLPGLVKEIDNSASPSDLLILSLEMLKYEEILRITSIDYAEISNDKHRAVYRNHNSLVIDYDNIVDGLKTGYTKRAGFCLAATSNKENYRLISIVLGVQSRIARNEIVAGMLNNYYMSLGCGPMSPKFSQPVLIPEVIAQNNVGESAPADVIYKTVWAKQRKVHRVRSGESLSVIAHKYNSTATQIKRWNSMKSDRIRPGQQLAVYVNVRKKIAIKVDSKLDKEEEDDIANPVEQELTSSESESVAVADTIKPTAIVANTPAAKTKPAVRKNNAPQVKYIYHTVQPGDTLWSISRRYRNITPEEIRKTNSLSNADKLKPGTRLRIKVRG